MIVVGVVEDSVSPEGVRLTSLKLTYPRFIHSELMTHRVFSRNSASSRAIPLKRFRQEVRDNLALPSSWGANGSGMGATRALTPLRRRGAVAVWWLASRVAMLCHFFLEKIGVHKEIANRVLEPFFHITVLVTSTEAGWRSFLQLRDHPDATPTIQSLAKGIDAALTRSPPTPRPPGEWHLPFVTEVERAVSSKADLLVTSVARCARVSYATFGAEGKKSTLDADTKLFQKLLKAAPPHASPFEHQASVCPRDLVARLGLGGNYGVSDWAQYRKSLGI